MLLCVVNYLSSVINSSFSCATAAAAAAGGEVTTEAVAFSGIASCCSIFVEHVGIVDCGAHSSGSIVRCFDDTTNSTTSSVHVICFSTVGDVFRGTKPSVIVEHGTYCRFSKVDIFCGGGGAKSPTVANGAAHASKADSFFFFFCDPGSDDGTVENGA